MTHLTWITGLVLAAAAAGDDEALRFDRDIRPILSDKCFHCHGPDDKHRKAKLRLDVREKAVASAITPGDPAKSEAWRRIVSNDPDEVMPPPESKKPLTPDEKALLKKWIEQGAEYSLHWAFVPPKRPALPKVSDPEWAAHPVDRFILAGLDAKGLKPTPEADRRTLYRRLSLDFTGLPPDPAKVEAFVKDRSPNAYEKAVDAILADRRFGERMAVQWLDAARYGDTSVYHADGPRDMWAWRDHVVRAYNRNQPFDRFSIEQLAGDLLENPTIEQQIASGFNRNNGTTDEGGAIAEEYRVEYAVDRVKTTSTVWLGLTMECAQCHDHKYDPISQEDYYRFYAFYNVSEDKGMQTRKGNAQPMIPVTDPAKEKELEPLRKELEGIAKQLDARRKAAEPAFAAWLKKEEAEARDGKKPSAPEDALVNVSLAEGKGKTVKDAADAKRKGQIKGPVKWVKGREDMGLKFEGRTYVDLGNACNFERTDAFSYGGWIYFDKGSSGAVLARMDDSNGYRGYDLYLSGNKVSAHFVHKWSENALKVTTKKALKPKNWYHLFVTYDGSSQAKGVTIYVNGKPWEWAIEQNGLKATIRTPKSLLIGSRHPGSRFKGIVDDVRIYPRHLGPAEVGALANLDTLSPILKTPAEKRTDAQVKTLREYFLANEDGPFKALVKKQAGLRAREADLKKPITTVMVMRDMGKPRDTFILDRGAYDQPTRTKVTAATPPMLPPMAEGLPVNRLGMAKWLFQDDHPLTARVTVNRYWQMLFGAGLVSTPADFGAQGAFPSHPELLDWLAVDFRENGWDVKRLLKQIAMSSTYRQASRTTPELRRVDASNRLLARGARFRLQGEFIRDTALHVSGLLVDRMGGPGVKPYQPPGLWKEVGLSGKPTFKQDTGEKLYRRSLYTYWKRSAPPPSMQIFDAPTREKCVVRRARTNTPLQALVTLNDVQFVEAARNLAQRMVKEGGASPETFAFRLCTARPPTATERETLKSVYASSLRKYTADAEAAKTLLAFGESKRDESIDPAVHAAWTVVASLILNLDETLTRE